MGLRWLSGSLGRSLPTLGMMEQEQMLACNQNPNTRPGKVRVMPLDDLLVHRTALETGVIKCALGAMAPGVEVHCEVT